MIKNLTHIYPLYCLYSSVKGFTEKWKYHKLIKKNNIFLIPDKKENLLYKEILYIELFKTLKSSSNWFKTDILPIGGAIDFKFAYILLRIFNTYQFKKIIEFGAGQSTFIVQDYSLANEAEAFTIENDKYWADKVRNKIKKKNHQVVHSQLKVNTNKDYKTFSWYDTSNLPRNEKFDLFIIDGPVGTKEFSRIGFIEFFLRNKSDDFVIIMDDMHRTGELQTFIYLLQKLKEKKINFNYNLVYGFKTVGIIYTSRFSSINFFF